MTEIIPTILVKNFDEVQEKIKMVENHVHWVQLDIMDGVFVDNKTWNNPKDLEGFKTKVKLEVHLMVERPETVVDEWLKYVDRVIVHFESKINDLENLIKKIHSAGKQIGIALNPETDYKTIEPFLNDLDLVLIMAVQPGQGGQELKKEALEKIRALRKIWPNANISVDGGVNDKNAEIIMEAGANLLCVGTYLFHEN